MFPLTISIPARFAQDHFERDLPCGEIIHQGKRIWKVRVNRDEFIEWESDADYYSDPIGMDLADVGNLVRSAQKTLERLKKIRYNNGFTD